MSLLKRIGGSGPLESNTDTNLNTSGNLANGTSSLSNPTGVLPRQTGRVGAPTEEMRRPGGVNNQENMLELKNRVQQKLIAELDPKLDLTKTDEVRRNVEEIFNQILESE